jgi:glycosyltransferase involved in cell wall biosynthesis
LVSVKTNGIEEVIMNGYMLTIAIPTFNRVEKLKICLSKVLEQIQNCNIEILVCDNGSTDGTEEFLIKETFSYPNLRYFRSKQNYGFDRNVLNCFEKSNGKYIWLLGDDDFILPGAVNSILSCISKEPILIHLNNCNIVSEESMELSAPRLIEETRIFNSKDEMLRTMGIYITFISGLVLRSDLVDKVENKKKYFGTYFFHSHIALQTMKEEGLFIVNGFNCLAETANMTISYDLYYVWFKSFYDLIICTGMDCGFNELMLKEIYHDSLEKYIFYYIFKYRKTCSSISKTWDKRCVWTSLNEYPNLKRKYRRIINCPLWTLKFWHLWYKILNKAKKVFSS